MKRLRRPRAFTNETISAGASPIARPEVVAAIAGCHLSQVAELPAHLAKAALATRFPGAVVDVLFIRPPSFWLARDQIYLDDPIFGDPVPLERLSYDPERGLHVRSE